MLLASQLSQPLLPSQPERVMLILARCIDVTITGMIHVIYYHHLVYPALFKARE